jgi:hypothetical protein
MDAKELAARRMAFSQYVGRQVKIKHGGNGVATIFAGEKAKIIGWGEDGWIVEAHDPMYRDKVIMHVKTNQLELLPQVPPAAMMRRLKA